MRPGIGQAADIIDLSQRLKRWRAAAVLTGALAACLLALVVVQETNPDLLPVPLQPKTKTVEVAKTVEVPSPRPAEFVAVLQRDAASPAFLLTFDLDKRTLTVRTVGAERQAGKSYELWLISDKYPAPRSLGVIGAAPYTVRSAAPEYDPVVINRATYAVSLEPEGGSPTGAPTGPVLYSGRLLQATAPDFPARAP
jgi:anti-sigma-K factor RskA